MVKYLQMDADGDGTAALRTSAAGPSHGAGVGDAGGDCGARCAASAASLRARWLNHRHAVPATLMLAMVAIALAMRGSHGGAGDTPIAGPCPAAGFGGLRLPDTVSATSYELSLIPMLVEPYTFSGSVAIRLNVRSATSCLVLNSAGLSVPLAGAAVSQDGVVGRAAGGVMMRVLDVAQWQNGGGDGGDGDGNVGGNETGGGSGVLVIRLGGSLLPTSAGAAQGQGQGQGQGPGLA